MAYICIQFFMCQLRYCGDFLTFWPIFYCFSSLPFQLFSIYLVVTLCCTEESKLSGSKISLVQCLNRTWNNQCSVLVLLSVMGYQEPASKISSWNHISHMEYIGFGWDFYLTLFLSLPVLHSKLVKSWHTKPNNANLGKAVRRYSRIFHCMCLTLTQL